MKVDLNRGDYHIHTSCSDGTYTPEDIVLWAKGRGLKEIAVTDHDGVEGVERAIKKGKEEGISVISGIEISTVVEYPRIETYDKDKDKLPENAELHMLGYGFDFNNKELLKACQFMREKRKERNENLFKMLRSDGYKVSMEDVHMYKSANYTGEFVGRPDIARVMLEKGYVENTDEVFDDIYSQEKYKAIKKTKLTAREAIKLITDAGGEAVLAHPGKIKKLGKRNTEEFYERVKVILSSITNFKVEGRDKIYGVKGLECYYAQHSEEEVKSFLKIAKEFNLFPTKGTDFHGD